MLTDLVQIRRLGQQNKSENSRFRAYLRNHRHSDRRLRIMAEEIESQIDCTQCANCCRVGEVPLVDRDIEKLSKFVGCTKDEFVRDYTQSAAEGGLILKRTEESGCVFLHVNLCSVYEARPHNCANYPHLVRGAGSIDSRMWEFLKRTEHCPIVYNWMEAVKTDIGFR